MSDEVALHGEVQRGEEAQRLLAHPLLVEAFETIEREVTEQWSNSPVRDVEGREKLWLTLKLLHRLKGQITSVVETGQMARQTLLQRIGLQRSDV